VRVPVLATTTSVELTLEKLLVLPETEPASDLIDGEVVHKAMPTWDNDARLVWLVDPDRRTVTASPNNRRILTEDGPLDGPDVLLGSSCTVHETLPPLEVRAEG